MDIKEKIKMLSGKSYWKTYNDITLSDGPNGVRKQEDESDNLGLFNSIESICFPSMSFLGQTFNKDLTKKVGNALASEAIKYDVDILLAPSMNMIRNPLCGRSFEYFSEDVFLTKNLALKIVEGIEEGGVGACPKHFLGNNQESLRMISNSVIDSETLKNLYLEPFSYVIKNGKPSAIMASYNKVNGEYVTESSTFLKDYLRNDLNYKGIILSDWGALNDPILSVKNGLNLDMPGFDKGVYKKRLKAFKKGKLKEDEIDDAIRPLLNFKKEKKDLNINALDIAYETALEGITLLKNDSLKLPLNKSESINIIGSNALNFKIQGSGSSRINPIIKKSFIDILDSKNASYTYYDDVLKLDLTTKSKTILFVGLLDKEESEGFDRKTISLSEESIFNINYLLDHAISPILIINTGSVVDILREKEFDTILFTGFGGIYAPHALYDILYGIKMPSGRLSQTFVNTLKYYPIFPNRNLNNYYTEGEYIGYKKMLLHEEGMTYPFGYGISYHKVNYSHFLVNDDILSFHLNVDFPLKEVILLFAKIDDFMELIYFDKVEINYDLDYSIDLRKIPFLNQYKGKFLLSVSENARDVMYQFLNFGYGNTLYFPPLKEIKFEEKTPKKSKKLDMNSTLSDMKNTFLGKFAYKIMKRIIKRKIKKEPEMEYIINNMIEEVPFRMISMGTNFKLNLRKVEGLLDFLNGKIFRGIFKIIFC